MTKKQKRLYEQADKGNQKKKELAQKLKDKKKKIEQTKTHKHK